MKSLPVTTNGTLSKSVNFSFLTWETEGAKLDLSDVLKPNALFAELQASSSCLSYPLWETWR